ncbi:MAG: pilus assembly protein PilM [Candidatus Omnitrophota bacterium]
MIKNKISLLLQKKVIGLHIGQDTVGLVVLKNTLQGPKVVGYGQTNIYPDQKDGELSRESSLRLQAKDHRIRDEYIIEAIQRLFKEQKMKPGNIVAAISNEDVMVRYFQMPKMPKHEWDSAIQFEAKRYIPFHMDEVAFDYQVMRGRISAANIEVLFIAVRENIISKFITLLEESGVTCSAIEPSSFSLLRALNEAGQIDSSINTALVNIERNMANIVVLRKGTPYIIRDIPLEDVSSGQTEKNNLVFEKLLGEVKLSFDFYEKQFPSEIIDKIILHSTTPIQNWHEVLGKELQVPVEVGEPFRGIRVKDDEEIPSNLACAYGLALRAISDSFLGVNLYREKLISGRKQELYLRVAFVEVSIALILLMVLKFFCMKSVGPLRDELDRLVSERPKVALNSAGQAVPDGLEKLSKKLSDTKDMMEDILYNRESLTSKLSDIAEIIPSNIWLTDIAFREEKDNKGSIGVTKKLNIIGYCIIRSDISEKAVVDNFFSELKAKFARSKGLEEGKILSIDKVEMHNEKIAKFEMFFTNVRIDKL